MNLEPYHPIILIVTVMSAAGLIYWLGTRRTNKATQIILAQNEWVIDIGEKQVAELRKQVAELTAQRDLTLVAQVAEIINDVEAHAYDIAEMNAARNLLLAVQRVRDTKRRGDKSS